MTEDPFVAHRSPLSTVAYEMLEVAGEPAAVSLVVEDGRVTRVYLVRNPRKLTRLDEPAGLAR